MNEIPKSLKIFCRGFSSWPFLPYLFSYLFICWMAWQSFLFSSCPECPHSCTLSTDLFSDAASCHMEDSRIRFLPQPSRLEMSVHSSAALQMDPNLHALKHWRLCGLSLGCLVALSVCRKEAVWFSMCRLLRIRWRRHFHQDIRGHLAGEPRTEAQGTGQGPKWNM